MDDLPSSLGPGHVPTWMKSTPTRDTSWASDNHLRRAALASEGVDRSPQLIYSIPGRVEMILGWWRDQIQDLEVLSGSDGTHVNEPKVRARTITVSPAVTSDLSRQEHMPPASPEDSMLITNRL